MKNIIIASSLAAYFAGVRENFRNLQGVPNGRFGKQSGAVVNVLSTLITNRDASPVRIQNRSLQRAPVMHARGVVNIANGDSIASTYRFFELPANAIPISLRMSAPDIGTTPTMDFALYKTTRDGGAVVSATFFKAAQALNAGPYSKVELVNGNIITPANGEKKIWEHLVLTADPQIPYDVVGVLAAASDAAGAVLLECDYIIG